MLREIVKMEAASSISEEVFSFNFGRVVGNLHGVLGCILFRLDGKLKI